MQVTLCARDNAQFLLLLLALKLLDPHKLYRPYTCRKHHGNFNQAHGAYVHQPSCDQPSCAKAVCAAMNSVDLQQLDLEDQGGVGRDDAASTAGAVA